MTHEELCSVYLQKWRDSDPWAKLALRCHRAPPTAAGLCTDPGEHRERLWALHQDSSDGFVPLWLTWSLGHVPEHVYSSGIILPTQLVLRLNQGRPTACEELMKTAGLKSLHCHWQSLLLATGKDLVCSSLTIKGRVISSSHLLLTYLK